MPSLTIRIRNKRIFLECNILQSQPPPKLKSDLLAPYNLYSSVVTVKERVDSVQNGRRRAKGGSARVVKAESFTLFERVVLGDKMVGEGGLECDLWRNNRLHKIF